MKNDEKVREFSRDVDEILNRLIRGDLIEKLVFKQVFDRGSELATCLG
jgi:hypothetical protein